MKKENIRHNASRSLWNYTLSPGWSRGEVEVLKMALQKFGIGRWAKIIRSQCLPGKSIGQIYLQTQRIMGQQSLGDFMGLQADIEKIFIDNSRKTNVTRKNNCIINTGDNPNKHERALKIEANRARYGLSEEAIARIRLPKKSKSRFQNIVLLDEIETPKFSTIEKIEHLLRLLELVEYKMEIVKKFGRDYFSGLDLFKPLPEELARKREALGVDEDDLLVERPLEKGGVRVEIVKNGKSLKRVKGGLENYFKSKAENGVDNGNCVEISKTQNGLNGYFKKKENGVSKNGKSEPKVNGHLAGKGEFNLRLKDVMDSVRKRMTRPRKIQISESERESAVSYTEEDGSLGESDYDEGTDPEEMMYRQYLQTGNMVKKVDGEVVIYLEKVSDREYKLK